MAGSLDRSFHGGTSAVSSLLSLPRVDSEASVGGAAVAATVAAADAAAAPEPPAATDLASHPSNDLEDDDDNTDDDPPTCRMCWSAQDPHPTNLARVAAAASAAGTPLAAVLAGGKLVSPCSCSGSMAHLHVRCLAAWQASLLRRGLARRAARCELCGKRYRERAPAALVLHYAKGGQTLTAGGAPSPCSSPRFGAAAAGGEQGSGQQHQQAAASASASASASARQQHQQQTRPRRRGVVGGIVRLARGAARALAADARVCRTAATALPSLLLRGWRAYVLAAGAARAARGGAQGLRLGATAGRSLASEQGRVLASFASSLSGVTGAPLARVLWLHAMGALALGMCTEVAYASLAGAGAGAALGFAQGTVGAASATARVSRRAVAGVAGVTARVVVAQRQRLLRHHHG
jgi:hypothetical protein